MASSEYLKRKREEYEVQLFSFSSEAVFSTLRNIVHEKIKRNSRKLCASIEKVHKSNEDVLNVLDTNEKQLIKMYYTAAAPYLKNIKNMVDTYISVPSNVLLKEDELQRTQYTDEEFESMQKKLENLQQRAKQVTIMKAALEEELHDLDQFETCNETINRILGVIQKDVECPKIDKKKIRLAKSYKELNSKLNKEVGKSQKSLYNSTDCIKSYDDDVDSL